MPRPGGLPPSHAFTVRADVGELALVHGTLRVAAGRVGEQERVLARVVGGRRRRVAAMVGRDDQQVAGPQRLEDLLEPPVEVLEAAMEVDRVVAVAPELVGLDEVHEHEPVVELLQQLDRLVDPVHVGLGRKRLVDVAAGEDVADLAHPVHLLPGVADERQVVRAPRLEREVMPVRRSLVAARTRRRTAAR